MKILIKAIRIILLILLVAYLLKPGIGNYLLKSNGVCKKAILTNDKEGLRYHKSTLLYQFYVNAEIYKGNSNIDDWSKAGDSICVVYLSQMPEINRPYSFFKGEAKCNCK